MKKSYIRTGVSTFKVMEPAKSRKGCGEMQYGAHLHYRRDGSARRLMSDHLGECSVFNPPSDFVESVDVVGTQPSIVSTPASFRIGQLGMCACWAHRTKHSERKRGREGAGTARVEQGKAIYYEIFNVKSDHRMIIPIEAR